MPFNPGQATKLERELGRLPNNKAMPIGVLGVDEQTHRPFSSRRLMRLDNTTNIDAVKEQLRKLKPASRERKVWDPNVRASSTPSLRQSTMDGPAIEDHVRDFEYASAQLQAARSREQCLAQENAFGRHPNDHQSRHQRGQHDAYGNMWYGESTMGRSDDIGSNLQPASARSTNKHQPGNSSSLAPPVGDWYRDDFFRSSDSDLRRSVPIPNPHPQQTPLNNPHLHPHHGLHQTHHHGLQPPSSAGEKSGYSSFFASEDDESDRDDFGIVSRGASRAHSDDESAAPRGRLRHSNHSSSINTRQMNSSPSRSPSPGPGSPVQHHIVTSASVPSLAALNHPEFPGRDSLTLSDHFSNRSSSPPTNIRRSLMDSVDSDTASHRSKDSGYDSGNSYEGFDVDRRHDEPIDELDDDDEGRRRRPAKVPANEDDDTGSRHQHVPETRLRTRRNVDEVNMPAGGPPTIRTSDSNTSLAGKFRPTTPSKTPGTQTPTIHAPTPIRSSARAGSVSTPDANRSRSGSTTVQPLIGPSLTPVKKNKKPIDEVEMTRFDAPSDRERGRSADQTDLVLEDSELPDLVPLPNNQNTDPQLDDTPVALELEPIGEPAPPRTTFYHLPDPRQLNRKKAIKDLQSGFSELYRGLHLLKRYAELNVEATDKILAKYEKNIARGHRLPFMRHEISNFSFSKSQELRLLISQTEYVYAQAFTGGHRTPAMQKLRVPEEEEDMESTTLRFGLLFGMSLGFMLIIIYMTFVVQSDVVQKMRPDLVVFRMLFIATLMTWYWGVDMWIWAKHRVNYPFIFEFNTRGHMRHQNIFDIASVFTVILIGDMMLYMLSALQRYDADFVVPGFEFLKHVPPELYPLLLVILLLGLFILYSFRSGFWLLRTLGRIVTAPLFKVVFRDFFLADQLVSITLVLQDIDFTICYFLTCAFRGGGNSCASNHVWMSAILATMPQFWRLLQCFRRYRDSKDKTNLYNAGKYSTGMLVAITSSLRSTFTNSTGWLALWLIFVIIATVYSYGWDIYKDWSIGDPKSVNWMLRDQLLYPKWWYYTAAIVNLMLRLMWTLNISPDAIASLFFLGKDGFTTVLVAVEISRRAMWNIFRLENEQLNNCGRFRAVQDIPLPLPLKPAVEEGLYQDKIK